MAKISVFLLLAGLLSSTSIWAKGGVVGCGPTELKGKISEIELKLVEVLHQSVGMSGSFPICYRYAQGDVGTWIEIHSATSVLGGNIDFFHRQENSRITIRFEDKGKTTFCSWSRSKGEKGLVDNIHGDEACKELLDNLVKSQPKRIQKIQSVLTHLDFASMAYRSYLNREYIVSQSINGKIPERYLEQVSGFDATVGKFEKQLSIAQSQMFVD